MFDLVVRKCYFFGDMFWGVFFFIVFYWCCVSSYVKKCLFEIFYLKLIERNYLGYLLNLF